MTNRERLISLVGFSVKDNAVDGELIDAGILGTAIYDGSNLVKLKTCALNLLRIIISTPDVQDDNGGGFTTSTKFDRPSVLIRIAQLEGELDLVTGPTIEAKSMW